MRRVYAYHFNTSHVVVYRNFGVEVKIRHKHFNTSHVVVYLFGVPKYTGRTLISIHLML